MIAGRDQVLRQRRIWLVAAAALLLVVVATIGRSGGAADLVPDAESVAQGRRIYREGILTSGQPLTGLVQGDVTVTAAQVTCLNCHQQSGFGSTEGSTVVPPVTGPALYRAKETGPRKRPPYSAATLARVIREGLDAAGQRLDPLMPRYNLSDKDVEVLGSYLKTLSARLSPGVEERAVHFATVVTEDADASHRQAMLDILETYIREKNDLIRNQLRGNSYGPSRARDANKTSREWVLSTWTLKGSAATWPAQLEAYYRDQPVFALLSGISAGAWRPMHEFCETHEVPCLLPNTDLPAITAGDFYTLYFAKGLTLEAEALAAHLSRSRPGLRILQVFRQDQAAHTAARVLRQTLEGPEGASVVDWILDTGETLSPSSLVERLAETRSTAAVLWLPHEALVGLGTGRWKPGDPIRIYLSSTLLGDELASVPEAIRGVSLVVHPFLLQRRFRRVEGWLASHGLKLTDPRIQAQTHFACLIADEGLKRVGENLHRDYFLDAIDHLPMTAAMSAVYPSLDFGSRRRYLSNGAYILELGGKDGEVLIRNASWVAP